VSSLNQFNNFTGELQTSINTFPVRLTFGNTQITPLMASFDFSLDGDLATKHYIQGGPGAATYLPGMRTFQGSLSIPIRITEAKGLELIATRLIDYTYFDNSELPQLPLYFEVETGYYKTANGFLVPPGDEDYDWNDNMVQILVNRCLITSLGITAQTDGATSMNVNFGGTLSKPVKDVTITSASTLSAVKGSFDINRALGYQDSKVVLNGSAVPNVTSVTANITREIVEQKFTRSAEAIIELGSIYPVIDIFNYSNDLPGKIGIKSFVVDVTIEQVLRRIDEDIYLSRGGTADNEYSGDTFLDVYFGPLKFSRNCSLVQVSEQPWVNGLVKRKTTFTLLGNPYVFKGDYLSIISNGQW
jgi:hypothetical protein